ncbi:thiamine-phosphate pyrophosphorylase [Cordyceps fumosorosea ARSEF 2679]|uniref:Thiamine-phosphate pyrophosphorylase n=1 Tax=Cordyceps fumosorosea (strain ARSEF 2679) TaxID=1081104 RepID=A0A168B078_CORFA|nr:thiamine-phosphate pyrophosphorylase [Cordyceps fumosorosea ARSEF 2679]OAA69435.1 thiamine-phosphate pyrophosphorylase [Cordyceps fumosorosea ARSEF 2679]
MLPLVTPKRPTPAPAEGAAAPPTRPPNYGVYLVTDSTPTILGDRDLVAVVEAALRGGVTCVQYRDKHGEREAVVATARQLHALTRRRGVPLLINDRVEVAVEVGCEGVHIGQDDMSVQEARKLLGDGKIIGVTASTTKEAIKACQDGADYLGIGTVYATATKKDTKSIIGPAGVRAILTAMAAYGHGGVPTVCIGGVNTSNATSVLAQASSPSKSLEGIAVVSAVVAAADPAAAASQLAGAVATAAIPVVVVQNFAANVALAVGASPIMSNYAAEAADLAQLGGALVVNMGTVTPEGLANYKQAVKAYNDAGRPIVLDPVGAGATTIRRAASAEMLALGRFAVIKGNAAEIQTLFGTSIAQRGVDSTAELTVPERARIAAALARRHDTVGGDALLATVAAAALYGAAAQRAVQRADVRGPGTFVPAFIDELAAVSVATAEGDLRWLAMTKVQGLAVD